MDVELLRIPAVLRTQRPGRDAAGLVLAVFAVASTVVAGVAATPDLAAQLELSVVAGTPAAAGAAILVRSRRRVAERAVWLVLGLCLLATAAATAVAGPAALDPDVAVPGAALVLWTVSYGLGVRGFWLLVRARLGRLQATTWLDGFIGAVVVQALLLLVLLLPPVHVSAGSVSALLFPFADLGLLGLFLAAAAQGGWRLRGWTPFIASMVLLSLADCAYAARALGAEDPLYSLAVFGWPASHVLLGVAAWSRVGVPEPFPAGRPWVPVSLGAIAAAVLGLAAITDVAVAGVAAGLALLAVIGVLARFAITLVENEHNVRAAQRQALADTLTGLANRRRLERDLADAAAVASEAAPATLVLFDLDGFKRYNDTFGHQAGDDLLVALGSRLDRAVAGRGRAYRLGGDEFCLLTRAIGAEADAVIIAAADALSPEVTGFPVTPSYGSVRLPDESSSPDEALQVADQRMYRHKVGKPERVELASR